MKTGIGMFGDLTFDVTKNKFQSPAERLHELLEQVKLADELGIDSFVLGEHHRPDYAVSSTNMVLAALASVTRQIQLASGVTVLSSADPVLVYQDYVTLDLLSNGRAEIIAGRGSFTESFPLFGQKLADYNELFEEKLELLLQLNKEEVIDWEGKFRPALKQQTVYPRPERQLPIAVAVGGTPESVYRAARLGLPVMLAIIGGSPRQFRPLIDFYKEEYLKHGHDEAKMEVGIHAHTFITQSKQELLDNYYPLYAAQMDRVGSSRGWPPYNKGQFLAGLGPAGALFMGETEEVADKILKTVELLGIQRFVAHIDVGGPEHKDLLTCINAFGTEIVPQLKQLSVSI
ncbi:LLM class flavin-dependent oxidoreductase [Roseimarinus sediminis]|uniref:LLM class flavin-dependent oxidoreductase n=1 Tax=Roseimarinus sediminis TaxID=1610899 RepID=UPI003D23921F